MQVVDAVRGELTSLQRATLGALVVMDVHARDVVTQLVADQVASSSDFEWQAQLRTYWDVNEVMHSPSHNCPCSNIIHS
jgi:dynein heavy chain